MDEQHMWRYASGLMPSVYDSVVAEAKPLLTHWDRNRIRSLLDFRIKRHSRYNLPSERLALLEKNISHRAGELLEYILSTCFNRLWNNETTDDAASG